VTSRAQTRWAAGLVAGAVVLAYANSLHGPFIFDDPSSITRNATIVDPTNWRAILRTPHFTVTAEGRPVLNASLAFNYALGGAAVVGYHLFNLGVHLAAALTLFGILLRVGPKLDRASACPPKPWRKGTVCTAAAIAILWAVHPLQTESVTYTVQRAESMMGLFYFLTLYGLIGVAERQEAGRPYGGFAALSIAACWLGMGTKEDMVSAPVIAWLFDRAFLAGDFRSALRRRGALYAALALSWVFLAYLIWSTGGNRGGSVGFNVKVQTYEYWLTQFPALVYYLRATFWPHPLIFEYGTFWIVHLREVWWQALLVSGLIAAAVWALWRRPAAGVAGALAFAVLAPTSLAPGTTQMIVEHRMYLPLAALLALLLFPARRAWPRATLATAGVLALAGIVLTWQRNAEYRDAVGLWELTVEQRPNNVLGHTMLAQVLDEEGRFDEARVHVERALQLNPHFKLAQDELKRNHTESERARNGVVSGARD